MNYDHWHEPPPKDEDAPWRLDVDPGPEASDYGNRPLLGDWLAGIGLLALILAVGWLFMISGAP